jgi:hypothetical protein
MIEDICIEVDDTTPSNSLEAFESILARIAGTAVAMYRDTLDTPADESDDILFKPDFDGTGEDDA